MRRRTGIVAVALCLGGALTACSGGGGDGHVAVGAAGSGPAPTAAVPPKGEVALVPLDEPRGSGSTDDPGAVPDARPAGTDTSVPPAGNGDGTGGGSAAGSDGAAAPGGTSPPANAPAPSASGSTTPAPVPAPTPAPTPAGPAVLQLAEPVRDALDKRWCEQVTVEFRNTGGSSVTSGTVTFATHIIGALGIDWATVESDQPLPAPIAPDAARRKAYTVCVDAWRVPLGMHIETRDVSAQWK
ncbi:hypothetical protein [Streptomyces sp. NPDC002889]|uniref:hypothetical protein n=1 Tax=Streptomyces sp. NPDC002889 TaxID=3364669 RepID=UPI00368B7B02